MKNEIIKRSVVRYINSENREIKFNNGKGCYVYTDHGQKYSDFVLGYGPVVLGHSNEQFNERILTLLPEGIHFPGFSVHHDAYLKALFHNMKVTDDLLTIFMKTSSESNTGAMRIAAEATKRKGVIRCGFTGWHDAQYASSVPWHFPPAFRNTVRNIGNMRGISNEEEVFNWDTLQTTQLEELLKLKSHQISSLIFDSYQLSFITEDDLRQAICLCRKYDILIILDETKSAGRVGPLGCLGQETELWDMLVTGKAIANGAPLSLLIVKEHLREATIKAQVGGTHSKEVMSIYCALTTLEIMNESNGYATLRTIGERTSTIFNEIVHECGLNELIKMSPILGGALVDITLADRLYNNPQTLKLLQTFFLDNSILLLVGHPSFISLAHSGMDWNEWRSQIFKSLAKWKKVL